MPGLEAFMDRITCGDCRDLMKQLPENSVDAIVTDPPYGLEFMGKEWDKLDGLDSPGYGERPRMTGDHMGKGFKALPNYYMAGAKAQTWHGLWAVEALRVLKPGGHALVFGGTRTYHRMVCALEDAGFEIRDTLCWLYGAGFPKSMDVSKAIDKIKGAQREVVGEKVTGRAKLAESRTGEFADGQHGGTQVVPITVPATAEAEEWDGWGTGLKPAHEPICLARKPISEGNVSENVLKWGTGAVNIDTARIGGDGGTQRSHQAGFPTKGEKGHVHATRGWRTGHRAIEIGKGRFPANLILTHTPECRQIGLGQVKNPSGSVTGDEPSQPAKNVYGEYGRHRFQRYGGSDGMEQVEVWDCPSYCPVRMLDEQSGTTESSGGAGSRSGKIAQSVYGQFAQNQKGAHAGGLGDVGGASRFFYCGKADQEERFFHCQICAKVCPMASWEHHAHGKPKDELDHLVSHPTQKPLDLVKYLVQLVTPKGGMVLDPFVGTGTTAVACRLLGYSFIGFDSSEIYCKIAERRLRDYPSLDRWIGC